MSIEYASDAAKWALVPNGTKIVAAGDDFISLHYFFSRSRNSSQKTKHILKQQEFDVLDESELFSIPHTFWRKLIAT